MLQKIRTGMGEPVGKASACLREAASAKAGHAGMSVFATGGSRFPPLRCALCSMRFPIRGGFERNRLKLIFSLNGSS